MMTTIFGGIFAAFSGKFSQDGDGYIYRRNPGSLSVCIGADDQRFLIQDFDRRFTNFQVFLLGYFIAVTVVTIGLIVGDFTPWSALVFAGALPLSAVWLDLWDVPEIAFYQRMVDMDKHHMLSALTRTALGDSWTSIVGRATLYAFCILSAFNRRHFDFLDKVFVVAFGAALAWQCLVAIYKAANLACLRDAYLYQGH